jgi:putative transposase
MQNVLSRLSLTQIRAEQIYTYYGKSRQGYFQAVAREKKRNIMMEAVECQVNRYRSTKDANAGSRTLYYNLNIKEQYNVGANKFEKLMSAHGLILRPVSTKIVTTQASSRSKKYSNLIAGLTLNNINQVVVGDLTYVYKDGQRYFVFSLFDLYSAMMVGIYGGKRMRALEGIKPLEQLIKLRGTEAIKCCIHHTDGGSQYFSNRYMDLLNFAKMRISVSGNCLDNGYAEQRNSMIKHHFLPLKRGRNEIEFNKGLVEIQYEYNTNRKQNKLGWRSPVEFERDIREQEIRTEMQIFNYKANLDNGFLEA